jgi:glycosyltransferase involved in cell wall biosynthesis
VLTVASRIARKHLAALDVAAARLRDGGVDLVAIEAALGEDVAARLREAGRRRAAAFSWERTAEAVDAVIGDVLAGRRAAAA